MEYTEAEWNESVERKFTRRWLLTASGVGILALLLYLWMEERNQSKFMGSLFVFSSFLCTRSVPQCCLSVDSWLMAHGSWLMAHGSRKCDSFGYN